MFYLCFQAEEGNQNDIEDLTALLNRMGSGKLDISETRFSCP